MPRCVSKHANRLTTCCCSMPENCGLMPWWASDTRVPRWVVRVRLRKFYATARQSSFSPRSPNKRLNLAARVGYRMTTHSSARRSSGAIRPLSTCRGSEGNMVRSWLISVTTCLLSIPLVAQEPVRPAVTGRWDLTIVTNAGRRAPSWLEVQWSGNRVLVGQFVGVVGSVRPISRLDFANDTLRFSVPPQWEEGNGAFQFTGVFAGDSLAGSLTTSDGRQLAWSGHRAPALEHKGVVQWGAPRRLFNARDLTGWHVVGGENQWKAVAGVLTNTQRGGNLVTDATYLDFKLHIEFRYPKEGNSGVYLRGRYEAQIEDSVVSSASGEATGGVGAIYGFLIPNQNAAKGA